MGEVSFADQVSAQGFYPGISALIEVLRSDIYSTVEKASNPQEAAIAVEKVFDEAKAYDEDGKFLGGKTDVVEGHFHIIKRGTVTEDSLGHKHRFSHVEDLMIKEG